MDEEPRELERRIEQATRIASRINDPTTVVGRGLGCRI
jgi:hypothetical protein